MTTSHDGDQLSSKGGYANNKDELAPTNNSIAQVSGSPSPSPPTQPLSPDTTTHSSSNLGPISYFRYHREDRLMGILAGLPPLSTTARRRSSSEPTVPATRSKDKASRPHTNVPLAAHSARDISVLGIGAWAEKELTKLRCP